MILNSIFEAESEMGLLLKIQIDIPVAPDQWNQNLWTAEFPNSKKLKSNDLETIISSGKGLRD